MAALRIDTEGMGPGRCASVLNRRSDARAAVAHAVVYLPRLTPVRACPLKRRGTSYCNRRVLYINRTFRVACVACVA